MIKSLYFSILIILVISCNGSQSDHENESLTNSTYESTGAIIRLDSAVNSLIPADAKIEIIASGFDWAEGPLWLKDQQALIFSDVPKNKIWRWSEKDSLTVYLDPSGFMGNIVGMKEPGSNGLALTNEGELLLCQHGERRIAKMNSSLDTPKPDYINLVGKYEGKRFNSPNDLVINSNDQLFFTDPPYGLDDFNPKELDFQGVYRLDSNGDLTLLIDSLSRPNGIGLSPDEHTLYVAQSNAKEARYYSFQLNDNGDVLSGKILLDLSSSISSSNAGLPDGLTIDIKGNLFASGPGGIWIIDPDGKVLGKIITGQAASNCVFDDKNQYLYITSDDKLLRLQVSY
jgi:gluconolactonase